MTTDEMKLAARIRIVTDSNRRTSVVIPADAKFDLKTIRSVIGRPFVELHIVPSGTDVDKYINDTLGFDDGKT